MNKKGDNNRSVRNTKKKLKLVLLTLLREKPINSITVRELTELADVNRGTFYFHYSDIYDMLAKLKNKFFNEFYLIVNSTDNLTENEAYPYITEIFSFLSKNSDLCKILLGPHGDMDFVNRLKKLVDEKCSYFLQTVKPKASPAQLELFNSFIINGFIGLFETWLSCGQKQTPEEMVQFSANIILNGSKAIRAE